MKIFTTIFLAHPLSVDLQRVDEANGLNQDEHDLVDLERALRARITVLESSSWFVGDSVDEE